VHIRPRLHVRIECVDALAKAQSQCAHDTQTKLLQSRHPVECSGGHLWYLVWPLIRAAQAQPEWIVWREFWRFFFWPHVQLIAPIADALGSFVAKNSVAAEVRRVCDLEVRAGFRRQGKEFSRSLARFLLERWINTVALQIAKSRLATGLRKFSNKLLCSLALRVGQEWTDVQ